MANKTPLYTEIDHALYGWLTAACRSRSIHFCDGSEAALKAHGVTGCELGTLHAAAADFAACLAGMIEQPDSTEELRLAVEALQELGRELERRLARRPMQAPP
jgi:hypothetical protein